MAAVRPFRGVYYGWVIVGGLALVSVASGAMGNLTVALFIRPMTDDLGISKLEFGLAQSARLLGFGASGWFLGRILDRHGARIPLAIAGALGGLVAVGLASLSSGWQIMPLFFAAGLLGLQGGTSLYGTVPVARWFVRQRGKAISIAALGIPVGIFVFAPLTQLLIERFGWRAAWAILGLGGAFVVVLVALVIIRRQPQDMGLLPDGEEPDPESLPPPELLAQTPRLVGAREHSWTRQEAVRSRAFWLLVASEGLRMLGMGTLAIFRVPFFEERGIDASVVALALSAEAMAALMGGIPAGWAVDRFQPRFAAASSAALMVVAFLATMNVHSEWQVFASTMLFGAAAMSFAVIQGAMWPAYFGGANIGSIRGFALPFALFFSGLGPPVAGLVKDATGSYLPAWIGGTAGMTVAAFLLLMAKKPERPAVSAPAERPAAAVALEGD